MLNNNNGVNLSFFQNIVLNKEGTHAAAEWLHKVLYNILLSIAVPNNNKSISQKYHTWYPPNLADTGRLAIYSRNCWKHHLVNQSRLFLKQHSAVCVKFPTIVWTLQCLLFLTLYCSFVFFFMFYYLGDMLLAFCLSMLVGLLLGALVYVLLTWASRRQATAKITRRSKKKTRTSQTNNPMSGLYRSTFLSVYRQPSLEPVGPLGSIPSPDTSTFRPRPKRSRAGVEMSEDTQLDMTEDTAVSNLLDSATLVPNKRHSFWLGGNGLKGFLPSQTPPPAYDSVIHAFEETCTWNCQQMTKKNIVGLQHTLYLINFKSNFL